MLRVEVHQLFIYFPRPLTPWGALRLPRLLSVAFVSPCRDSLVEQVDWNPSKSKKKNKLKLYFSLRSDTVNPCTVWNPRTANAYPYQRLKPYYGEQAQAKYKRVPSPSQRALVVAVGRVGKDGRLCIALLPLVLLIASTKGIPDLHPSWGHAHPVAPAIGVSHPAFKLELRRKFSISQPI